MTAGSPTTSLETPTASRQLGVLMLIAASVLWSLAGLAVKTARIPNPVVFVFYRCVAAAVPMALLIRLSAGKAPGPRLMGLSIVTYAAVVGFLIASMTIDTAATGILLQYTSPVFCAIFGWAFYRRRINRRTMLSLIIAAAGIAIMLGFRPIGQQRVGPLMGLLSGVAFGALPLILAEIDRRARGQANLFLVVFCNNLGAAMIFLVIIASQWGIAPMKLELWQFAIVAGAGVFQIALPYVLFQLALRRVNPVDASLLVLLEPVLNPIWVLIFVGEKPGPGTLIGGAAILVALVVEATKKKN